MPKLTMQTDLSLYIHLPWCIKKCPYCDFNSHELKAELPEDAYIDYLIEDFKSHLDVIKHREIKSVFFVVEHPVYFQRKHLIDY